MIKKGITALGIAIISFLTVDMSFAYETTESGLQEKLDPAALAEYTSAMKMTKSLIAETHELLKSQNTKKAKRKGGFVSEESKQAGMMLLKKYGDTRLEIETLQERLESRKNEPSIKSIYAACSELHSIVDDGRNKLLNAYQFTDDRDKTALIIKELAQNLALLSNPKGRLSL